MMNTASSWSSKEPEFDVRHAAQEAARRAGLSLHEWLDETWRLHAVEIRASVEDLDDDERAYAVARRLKQASRAAQGSRRSDRSRTDGAAKRRISERDAGERIWARVSHAFEDFDAERPQRQRRETSWDVPAERRPRITTRPAAARAQLSIDEAMDEIFERQSELESRARPDRRPARAQDEGASLLKNELAKVAEALASLQHEASEHVTSAEVEALRADVAQIARGMSALAPREMIEHIQAAVHDLGARLSEARTAGLVEEFIAPVEELISDLNRTVLGAAPTAALEAIEKRIGALSRNVDALAEARIDPDSVANLLEHSQDIRAMLSAAAANRPNVEAVEKRISDLAGRIDRISERGATSAGLDAILKSVAQIREDLEFQNPLKSLKALDGRMDALARKMDQAASRSDVDAHFDRLGKRLDAMHRDLAERAPEGRRLEEMFLAIQARIDQARPAASPTEMRDLVSQLMGKIDQAVGAGAEPMALTALEDQISRVAARIEARQDAPATDLTRIESLLESISQRLDNPLPISAADQVQETVRLLIERFESTLRSGVTGETLAAIERRLAEVATRLDAPVAAELDTTRLESMIQDLAARMEDPAIAASDVVEIKRALARLADRMDAALRSGEDQSAIRGVEEQIAALTQRMEKAAGGGVDRLERSLTDIQQQMERLSCELEGPARDVIEREISDLRSLHAAADRRTHATLNAVHETLEKVVDRLAMLEEEVETAARFVQPAPVAPETRRRDAFDDYRPSIELNFGPAAQGDEAGPDAKREGKLDSKPHGAPAAPAAHAPAPAAAAPATEAPRPPAAPAPAIVAERPGAAPSVRPPQQPAAPKINTQVFDDFLLEPGSGKPSPRDVAAAQNQQQSAPAAQTAASSPAHTPAPAAAIDSALASPAADAESSDAQATFIAAIRRAQQAAGVAGAPADGGSTGNQLLDEARARARAAAAEAEAQQTKTSGGGPFGLKSLFSGRKKATTAAGLTGLVVILGALQAASMFYQSDKSRTMRTAAAPPASAKLPEKADAPRMGAIAPPADRFTQSAGLADMTPVASVPLNASRAPAAVPLEPRDPFLMASSGDAHAQYELGVRFAEGRHGPRDAAKAIDWLTKSAGQSFAPAQYRLGVIYEKGIGVPRNPERARTLYLAAAERGNVKAMHNLGALLADGGADGKPDYAAAARWFRIAAEHGVRDSQYNLAILAARGLGVQQDLVDSYAWFSAAGAQGDADANAKLKEVAARLSAAQLTRAQATAKAHRPKPVDPAVNEPLDPEEGWATAPAPATKPTASRSPKISSLQAR